MKTVLAACGKALGWTWRKICGAKAVQASLISILIGMVAGSIIIFFSGLSSETLGIKAAWEGIQLVFAGLFSTGRDSAGTLTFGFNPQLMGNMLFRAMPLIMTGLSVALSQKTGLFNIGAPGQYLMGTAATLLIALYLPTGTGEALQNVAGEWITHGDTVSAAVYGAVNTPLVFPAWLVWTLALLGGMLAGALWGAIPGMLKAWLNINEVLACIMTNWIAANLVTWVFDVSALKNAVENTKMGYIYKTTFNGVQTSKLGLDQLLPGSQVSGGIMIAIIFAIVVYILLNRTTFGYELKACGSNRFAARYAGIQDKRSIIVSMAMAGALAGAGAALYYLAGNTEFYWETSQSLPAVGFNGIPVALLAANHPIGVIFAGLFMSMLEICGQKLKDLTAFNEYITDVIIAAIVYLSAFSMLIRMLLNRKSKKEGLK
ncbi:MAG: ABC transporter permease [Clostridia bacterium]|nr:ABC transporter permease [Clostridia bacterium]